MAIDDKRPGHSLPRHIQFVLKILLFAGGSLCYALLGILSQLSKEEDGTYAYSVPSVIFTAEALKLLLTCVFLVLEQGSVRRAIGVIASDPAPMWLASLPPSLLYSLNNNLDVVNNLHMDPATEQVLVQGKILTTSVIWWAVFRESLGIRKCLALVLLFFGAVLAALPSEDLLQGTRKMHIDAIGCFLIVVYCTVSASASVYNEWLLKVAGKGTSIHVANFRLYVAGCLFNLFAHSVESADAGLSLLSFKGYNRYVVGLVLTYTFMGLLLSQVMKWFDNIVKLFISGSSMYVSAVCAWCLFGYAPTWLFSIALGLVTLSIGTFHAEKIQGIFMAYENKDKTA